jgi:hypothetical protein
MSKTAMYFAAEIFTEGNQWRPYCLGISRVPQEGTHCSVQSALRPTWEDEGRAYLTSGQSCQKYPEKNNSGSKLANHLKENRWLLTVSCTLYSVKWCVTGGRGKVGRRRDQRYLEALCISLKSQLDKDAAPILWTYPTVGQILHVAPFCIGPCFDLQWSHSFN